MSKRVKVKIITASEPLVSWVYEGQTVWEAVQQAGVLQRGDCGGRGICSKCKARVEGEVSGLSTEEEKVLTKDELQRNVRLTCKTRVVGDAVVYLPETRIASLKGGLLMYEKYPGVLSAVRQINSHVPPFDRLKPIPLRDRVQWAFKDYPIELTAANANMLAKMDQGDGFRVTGGILDSMVVRINPQGKGRFCGLALDIGTTTISCALIDLITGELLGERRTINSQITLGRDVLGRISYIMENENGIKELNSKVIQDVNLLIDELLDGSEIEHEDILEMTVVGNPVMLHLFRGLDPQSLGRSPYVGLFRGSVSVRACPVRVPIHPSGRVFLLPQIAGFLGSDIVACLIAVDDNSPNDYLLLDIGTNGEMVLKCGDVYKACSVAAGSAFEGGGITSGMVAAGGAIDRVWFEDGQMRFNIIGSSKPVGICGSGLIDLLKVLMDMEVIDETGLILPEKFPGMWSETSGGTELVIVPADASGSGSAIVFNQQDVRQLQLAKGAIRAGIDILIKESGTRADDVEEVLFAGAFGNYLNPEAVMAIGMIPRFDEKKIKPIGNAALRGALAALISLPERDKATRFANNVVAIELADHLDFNSLFMDSLGLK